MTKIFMIKDFKKLIISILISEGVGILSALLTMGSFAAYQNLKQPSFAPPGWIFAPVWAVLFLLMGIASYRIWLLGIENKDVKTALTFYLIQLGLNFIWPIIFFNLELRGLAFLEIIILLIFIILTTQKFYKLDKAAAYLMFPYIIWVAFAAVLNYSIWMLK